MSNGVAAPASPACAASWALRGLFAIVLVFALREAGSLLAPVLIAVVLTFVLAPAVRWLRRRGVPEVAGAGLLVLLLLGGTVSLAVGLAQPATDWWNRLPATVNVLSEQFDRLRASIPGLAAPQAASAPVPAPPARARAGAAPTPPAPAPPPPDPVKERLASESVALTGALFGHGLGMALSMAATLILLYFLLACEHWMLSRCVEAVPRRRARALLLGGVRAAQREIGRYLFALGCINLGAGVLTGLAMAALGLANPVLWAVVTAVLNFVPYLGPMINMGLLLLAGIVSFDTPAAMLAPVGVFLLIHAIESNFFSPWLVGRRLSLSPLAVFVSVLFWGWLWGIAGALIAVPLLIAMRSLFWRQRRLRGLARVLEGDHQTAPPLRVLLRPRSALRDAIARRRARRHAAVAPPDAPPWPSDSAPTAAQPQWPRESG